MSDADDLDMLAVNNQRLERENKALRASLRDQFAMAALPLCFSSIYSDAMAEAAYELADAMLAARECHGQPEKEAKNEGGAA